MQAELMNKRNGHENEGYLSLKAAFSPLNAPLEALPPSHAIWDHLASELPALLQSQTLRTTVDRMPLLSADAKGGLADHYLLRAASIPGIVAHAYVRLEGNTPLTVKYNGHSEVLPQSIVIPWTQVCKRLGRSEACLSYVDLVISNFKTSSRFHRDVTLANSHLLIPTVNNKEENVFFGTTVEINANVIPIFQHIIDAQKSVLNEDMHSHKISLRAIIPLLRDIGKTLHKISLSRTSSSYVEPDVWTSTVANLAVPWLRVTGAAGTAHPLFHLMDVFTGRSKYESRIGKEAMHIWASFPAHWQQFIHAIGQVSVKDFIDSLKERRREELSSIWSTLQKAYSGIDLLLGLHRRKVYGYLSVLFRVGRDSTINGLGHLCRGEQLREADAEIEKSRQERTSSDMATRRDLDIFPKGSQTFAASEIIQHTSESQGYWFTVGRDVYDPTNSMQRHSGGATILVLCSGQDVTADLEAVRHLSDPKIIALLARYRKRMFRKLHSVSRLPKISTKPHFSWLRRSLKGKI